MKRSRLKQRHGLKIRQSRASARRRATIFPYVMTVLWSPPFRIYNLRYPTLFLGAGELFLDGKLIGTTDGAVTVTQ